jgi:hypothetical protein
MLRRQCPRGCPTGSDEKLSSPAESHRQALPEPDVNLSIHPAPIVQPVITGGCDPCESSSCELPTITPDDNTPSVQFQYRTFVPTTSASVPVPLLGTPALAGATRLRISRCIGTTGSYVPHPRLNHDHAAFMPDASGAVHRSPLLRGTESSSRFRRRLGSFDRESAVFLRSSS